MLNVMNKQTGIVVYSFTADQFKSAYLMANNYTLATHVEHVVVEV